MAEFSVAQPDSIHILVVDSDEEVLETLCQLLRSDGYQVTGVSSVLKSLKQLRETPVDLVPHLVLTHLMMPEVTGWQILRTIKKAFKDILVVVLLGHEPGEGESTVADEGADGYLVKPVDRGQMQALFKSLLLSQDLDRQAQVVVIDDEADALVAVDHALRRRGLDVIPFQDPGQALEHMQESPPDLVIIDLHILGISGFDICQIIRSEAKTAQVPILMVTSDASKENVVRSSQLGINGFMAKPFDLKALGKKVLEVLGQAGDR